MGKMAKNEDGMKKRIVEGSTTKLELPKAVVAPELMAEMVPLRDAWVGTLKDKRNISAAIRHMTKILPGMSHLKRCSGKRLVLAFATPRVVDRTTPAEENETHLSRQELEDLLSSDDSFDRSFFETEFEAVAVPAVAPKTKAQATKASQIWPINFHPDPYIERTLNGSCFDSNDLEIIDRCIEACIEAAAREAHGNDACNGSAIIFDPNEGKIVALAASRIHQHPMWHAAMLAVDLVARLERGGGVYELNGESVNRKRKYSETRCNEEPPLAYPASLRDIVSRLSIPYNAPAETSRISSLTSEIARTPGQKDNNQSAYLCTNYWVFLLREPCALCAMALVHSRVSNIFYGTANENRGVLGSRALLHAVPGLNHRYRVWRGIRENECYQTCIEISGR